MVLTEAGRAAIERAAPAHVETVRQLVFDGLTPGELAALTALTGASLTACGRPRRRAPAASPAPA